MPDLLNTLGRACADPFWLPVLAWTALALPIVAVARIAARDRVLLQRDLHTAVLLSLPAALPLSWALRAIGADLVPAFPWAAAAVIESTEPLGGSPGAVLPFAMPADAARVAPVFTVETVIGLATLLAAVLAVAGIGRLVAGAIRLRRIVRNAEPVQRLDGIDVLFSQDVAVPVSCGILRRRILIPAGHSDRTDVVIAHERLHHELGDVRRTWLVESVRAAFAVHPLVHLLARRVALLMEMACDRSTLERTGIAPAEYAGLLVSNVPVRHDGPFGHLSPVAVPMGRSHRELRDRIRAMERRRGPIASVHPGLAVAAIALLSAVLTAASVERDPVVRTAESPPAPVAATTAVPDTAAVTGRVLWASTGEPAVGANVQVEGLSVGAATDRSGRFVILGVPPGVRTLVVSFVGAVPERKTVVVPEDGSVTVHFELRSGTDEREVYVVVEEMPELVGGLEGLQERIRYPEIARRAGIEGRVIVQFIVGPDGGVSDMAVVMGRGAGLDEEAMRVIREAEFRPGRQRGEPVHVRMSLPVAFRLSDGEGSGRILIDLTEDGALFLDGDPVSTDELRERLSGRDLTDTIVMLRVAEDAPMGRVSDVQKALRGAAPLNVRYGREPSGLPPNAVPRRDERDADVFIIVEEMPELIGGLAGIQKSVDYPAIAEKAGVEGRVIVQLIVDTDGSVIDPVVVRGIGAGCDEEALRVVREARFTPGRQRGEAVKVKMSLPVTFDLDGGADLSRPGIPVRRQAPGERQVREPPPPPPVRADERGIDVYTDAADISRPWVMVAHGGPIDAVPLERKIETAVAVARMNDADAVIVGTADRAPVMGDRWPVDAGRMRPGQWVIIRYVDE